MSLSDKPEDQVNEEVIFHISMLLQAPLGVLHFTCCPSMGRSYRAFIQSNVARVIVDNM